MWWLRELTSCFRFLSVTGSRPFWESKRIYEFVIPGVLASAIFVAYVGVPQLFAEGFLGRFVGNLFQFMVFVVPFHLAALAAFATFERSGLDEPLAGTNADVRVWSNRDNDWIVKALTLRQYASLLFGYLCAIGIVFIIAYIIIVNINFTVILGNHYGVAYKVGVLAMLFFVAHYAVLSAYAITFLFDKVNKISA